MLTGKINYSNASDTDLITLLREGNHNAFIEIYNRYYYLLFASGYKKLRNREQTKDIVQELFADLWVKKETIFTTENLAGYLMVAARNKIFNLFEHQKVESKYIESLKDFANTGNIAHTDYLVRKNQLNEYIEREIQALPKKMRRIFEMSRKENLSNRKIAENLNTSESNVSHHISNATKILRTKLGSIFLYLK